MIKHLTILLAISISLQANAESNFRERLDAYHNSSLTGSEKERLFKELTSFVKTALPDKFNKAICRNATKVEYTQFIRVVNFVKKKVNDHNFTALTAGEISYFIECENGTNAITYNYMPDNATWVAEGLTPNTAGLIHNAGLLLFEPDHTGRTPLDYAEEKRDEARSYKGYELATMYQMIINDIKGAMSDLSGR